MNTAAQAPNTNPFKKACETRRNICNCSVDTRARQLKLLPSSRAYWILVEGSRSFISAVGKWLFAVRDRTEERIRHTAAPEKQFHQSWRCSSCVLTHELNKLESAEFDKREQRFGAVTRISY
ncbi:hypothetical protein F2P81_007550 [Scophthalmus maximus]|uniref:Uncharacterized protein n=1 Tax=Scophthalmus maximus TaxID=52904 RepID=A0A6A4T2J5_SCOMX|nr:hypothetical protein F2P81_007550 [Scophthalmus maximus]